jgi:hypothetical protein
MENTNQQVVSIPLVQDGALHTYTYDLKLLQAPPQARLTGLRLDLAGPEFSPEKSRLQISEVGLIGKGRTGFCAP